MADPIDGLDLGFIDIATAGPSVLVVATYNDNVLGERYSVAAYNVTGSSGVMAWQWASNVSNGAELDTTDVVKVSADGALAVVGSWGDATNTNPQARGSVWRTCSVRAPSETEMRQKRGREELKEGADGQVRAFSRVGETRE